MVAVTAAERRCAGAEWQQEGAPGTQGLPELSPPGLACFCLPGLAENAGGEHNGTLGMVALTKPGSFGKHFHMAENRDLGRSVENRRAESA